MDTADPADTASPATKKAVDFTKYDEKGAYHWRGTYGEPWYRHRPRYHARYGIPLRMLSEHLDLSQTRGVDVGCGDGVLLYKACRYGGQITGLDLSETALALAEEELCKRGVTQEQAAFVHGSCYDMPFEDGSLDYATAVEVIEHLDDVPAFLREVRRVLRPGGWLVCTTPMREAGRAPHEVEDPFHVREYLAPELRDELARVFPGGSARVHGAYPAWLDRWLYKRGGTSASLDKAVRLFVRTFSLAWNPYLYALPRDPAPGQSEALVGLAQKAETA